MLCYIVYTGSVYVYGSMGNIWSRQSKLLAKDGIASDKFGSGVSIYGTTAMSGANGDDDKATDAGMKEYAPNGYYILCETIIYTVLVIYSRICNCL
jgi:hypothetical protein